MPRTVLIVTHDLNEAFALADRVAVLQEGEIVACAPPAMLRESDHPFRGHAAGHALRMSALLAFLSSHRDELLVRIGEHIVLVAVSTAIAVAVGVPLGILAARRPALARPLVGLANLAQTIPSLALFGFLIPLPFIGGVGTRTALVALTLYAVLPIVRTTIAGLAGRSIAPSSSAPWRWA